mgnify:CR=1 FL=1
MGSSAGHQELPLNAAGSAAVHERLDLRAFRIVEVAADAVFQTTCRDGITQGCVGIAQLGCVECEDQTSGE